MVRACALIALPFISVRAALGGGVWSSTPRFGPRKTVDLVGGATDDAESDAQRERLYEAYNSLHSLANTYKKPFDVPSVVVIGAQSSGKSALVEALMGFQFNEVGGGTRTRRPIALQMHYNAACDEPACYIMDERFTGGEPVEGGAQFERRATLAEARRFIEEENRRLERDQHRSFEAREIVMRVEYRHCPNLVLVDTPGLVGGGGDVFGDDFGEESHESPHARGMKRQAREAYELALGKARARNAVLLCVDDGNDWKLGSIARRLCADADPTLSRTVVVSTKLDTKLVQFGSGRDVASFLRAKVLHDLHPRLLAGPFFTSVPCGRVAGAISPGGDAWDPQGGAPENQPWDLDDEGFYEDDGVAFRGDAEFRAATARASRADRSLVKSKVGFEFFDKAAPQLGVGALRQFLERHVELQYRSNVARVVPLLRQERLRTEAALEATDIELDALTPEKLRRSAETIADKFCRSLSAAVAGAVSAPPDVYGERLADERLNGGAFQAPAEGGMADQEGLFDDPDRARVMRGGFGLNPRAPRRPTSRSAFATAPGLASMPGAFNQAPPPGPGDPSMQLTLSQTALDGAVGHADANLYGGAQYRRALREFALAVRHLSLPSVDGDEIANALGVGDAHDGADFVRASCVIAVDKARRSFEPQLQTLAERVSHVMRRLPPVIECMMESQPGRAFGTSGPRSGRKGDVVLTGEASGPYEGVMQLIASIYDTYVHELADRAVARCKDDLEAMTRFVTWDLASSSDAKSAVKAALEPTPDLARALDDLDGAPPPKKKRRSKANKWFSAKDEVAVEASVLDDWKRSVADEDSDVALSSDELVEALAQPRGALSPVATPTEIVGSLVRRIAAAWREHFARTVAVKFNCFFLMPFVDDFPLYLREKLDDHVHTPENGGDGAFALFDVARARAALEKRRDDLRNELAANAKLHDTFDSIQRACAETAPSP